MRDKPFDVVNENRTAYKTSLDWATPLVDECEVKRRKECPTTDKRPSAERKLLSCETVR